MQSMSPPESAVSIRPSLVRVSHWPVALQQEGLPRCSGEISLAFRRCHTAWLATHPGSNASRPAGAEDYLATLVSHHLHLADLLSAEDENDQAAEALADIHQKLLLLVADTATDRAWSRAALWHIRNTHRALLAHLSEYGFYPAIERALRAGCLTLQLPATHLH